MNAHGRGVLAAWAAETVAMYLANQVLGMTSWSLAALKMLAVLDAHGHVLPLELAARLDGVRRGVSWSGAEADRTRALLTGVVARALRDATPDAARVFGRAALSPFLSRRCGRDPPGRADRGGSHPAHDVIRQVVPDAEPALECVRRAPVARARRGTDRRAPNFRAARLPG